MMNLLFLLLTGALFAQTEGLQEFKWYLNPQGQEVKVSIDDLHDEIIQASPAMDWGARNLSGVTLKRSLTIAVIDGGIDIEHPELKDTIALNPADCYNGNVIPPMTDGDQDGNGFNGDCAGWNFVDDNNRTEDLDGHGTHVAGIIAEVTRKFKQSIKILPLKVFAPDEGRRTVAVASPLPVRLARAFEYAIARKVDVIHMSVGWPKSLMSPDLEAKINLALEQGILVVSAAGNSSQMANIFPCKIQGVICVGALRANGDVARFSNWGSQVDLFAPGEKILSTIPSTMAPLHISRKGYDYKNGTSQAAPFISGALAILKGVYPEEPRTVLYARLMQTAGASAAGVKGLFHLDQALSVLPRPAPLPDIKGLSSILVDSASAFTLTIPFRNYWKPMQSSMKVELRCEGAQFSEPAQKLVRLGTDEASVLGFSGTINGATNDLDCELTYGQEALRLQLKVLHPLSTAASTIVVDQTEVLVANTRQGGRSRFLTLNTFPGTLAQTLYYVPSRESVTVYNRDRALGTLPLKPGCKFLRLWQHDLTGNGEHEILLETLCDQEYLRYQFLDLELRPVFPATTYRPGLTIVNYENFEIIRKAQGPPVFRFLNRGFSIPSTSPWEQSTNGKANHLYELTPEVQATGDWKFQIKILEEPKQWTKDLGLRYEPSYLVLHYVKGKLLLKIGGRTAWVDVETQRASWANLDDLLLLGSRQQQVFGSDDSVLQSFLTPWEYRGFVLKSLRVLRFLQSDRFDPLLDVLGTYDLGLGRYRTILRSFQHLIYLEYDSTGVLTKTEKRVVDRFDFLTAQDLIASVINLYHEGQNIQVVDGTKVNTDYIDVIRNGRKKSFKIPGPCVTHQPVLQEGSLVLPVFCAKSARQFEMRFIEL